jgi:hypothetical protein
VKVNLREVDKLDYWRKIDSINYKLVEPEFSFD